MNYNDLIEKSINVINSFNEKTDSVDSHIYKVFGLKAGDVNKK